MPTPVLVKLPVPVMAVASVPALTVRAVLAVNVPPLSVPMEETAPLRVTTPVVWVVMVPLPPIVVVPPLMVVIAPAPVITLVPPVMVVALSEPAFTVPPEISEVRRPVTLMVPAEIPPLVMVALLAKVVAPAPVRLAMVMVPEEAVKLMLLATISALETAPRVCPALAKRAVPPKATVRASPLDKLPVLAMLRVPAVTVVNPL